MRLNSFFFWSVTFEFVVTRAFFFFDADYEISFFGLPIPRLIKSNKGKKMAWSWVPGNGRSKPTDSISSKDSIFHLSLYCLDNINTSHFAKS